MTPDFLNVSRLLMTRAFERVSDNRILELRKEVQRLRLWVFAGIYVMMQDGKLEEELLLNREQREEEKDNADSP